MAGFLFAHAMRVLWMALFATSLIAFARFAIGQDSGDASKTQYANLAAFRQELTRLAAICDRVDLADQAKISRAWLPVEREDQTVLYLPTPALGKEQVGEARLAKEWGRRFEQARMEAANMLFAQATQMAAADEGRAYRFLWHVLREDATHSGALQALGTLARAHQARPRQVRGRSALSDLGWSAGSYRTLETPHFRIITRAGVKESYQLAAQLEQYFALWTQFFYPLWAPPGTLQRRIDGQGAWPKQRSMEVVFLKDRSDYLRVLGVAEDNIGISVGYYNPGARKSFFYPVSNSLATLHHELTHQLLLEATHIDARESAGVESGIWLLEGGALYMESLANHGSYWTVGGIESPRLQTARYRGVRDGFWPPWNDFSSGGMEEWKRDPILPRLYSHAAGLTHVLMDSLGSDCRRSVFKALVGLYQGDTQGSRELLNQLADTEDQAKLVYQQTLRIDDVLLAKLFEQRVQPADLVLCGSELQPNTWRQLNEFEQLQWLDVSFSNVRTEDLEWLSNCRTLKRLSLEGTAVTGEILDVVSKLPALEELDLSGCAIDDRSLEFLRDHKTLEILWLTQTSVSKTSLSTIASLSKLRQCDVQGSRITEVQWTEFLQRHKQLSP